MACARRLCAAENCRETIAKNKNPRPELGERPAFCAALLLSSDRLGRSKKRQIDFSNLCLPADI
jgi:hypothetical protein